MSKDTKISSPSSSNRSKGGIQRRVVSVPINDVQKLRLKGDHQISTPPSDSWAWRKYGQKPIKGSPYPRGYYKCSSSKVCPARKQVERSKLDPNMLVVTYSCEHNHPWPDSINNHHHHRKSAAAAANITTSISEQESEEEEEEEQEEDEEEEEEEKKPKNLMSSSKSHELISEESKLIANNIGEGPLVNYAGEFGLFSDFESSSCTAILDQCPILTDDQEMKITTDNEMAMIFTTMVEEDESLIFSDLGELPECATVFRWSDAGVAWRPPAVEAVCKP